MTETRHYSWPEAGRGQVVLEDSGYTRAIELLMHLEFGRLDGAVRSTARWVGEVNVGARWGHAVLGRRATPAPAPAPPTESAASAVNNLSGMVRRKRPAEDDGGGVPAAGAPVAAKNDAAPVVNTLGAGLVRKKAKISTDEDPQRSAEPGVNVLGAGLVRKKAKPAE